jgi:adenine-specific DNA-methyltransferase
MAKKASRKTSAAQKSVETITHAEDKRRNIPTVEYQSVVKQEQQQPVTVKYPRNVDLDPQLVWRGKDQQDWSDLVVHAPPLYIQEKVHPKVLIDELLRQSQDIKDDEVRESGKDHQLELFSDFNGVPEGDAKTEFYQHDQNWTNRMILGDSLQVMASLAEREGLRGKVQCIYFDPPYGIKFNSNFQWSTTTTKVEDGKANQITREPEQVKAFRDTWRDGIHSYLTYLRDRLTVARDLLTETGSIFVQISEENVHRVRTLLDEVFGDQNFVSQVSFIKTMGQTDHALSNNADFLLWYARSRTSMKFRECFEPREPYENPAERYIFVEPKLGEMYDLTFAQKTGKAPIPAGRFLKLQVPFSQTGSENSRFPVNFCGRYFLPPGTRGWSTSADGMKRLQKGGYLHVQGNSLWWKSYRDVFPYKRKSNYWTDTRIQAFLEDRVYIVQTSTSAIKNCILMTSDPGDLVIDPTCGSGTTAYTAEQWGRRWITIDTSRVALALARARVMGARYSYYLLADSKEGQAKVAEVERSIPSSNPVHNNIRHGFVYERVPHITLKSIANNAEIDVIWDKWQETLEQLRTKLNASLKRRYEEWEIPREAEDPWPRKPAAIFRKLLAEQQLGDDARPTKLKDLLSDLNAELKHKKPLTLDTLPERPVAPWDEEPTKIHSQWWAARIARQQEIDASIAAKAEFEYLYDKPYEDKKKVRVAGPFTVESLSPHRTLGVDENDDLIDNLKEQSGDYEKQSFPQMVLENLKTSGVQQAHKEDRITFTSLVAWPGDLVCAEGHYLEGETERRAAIFIGPEFGTVQRQDLVLAAREAGDANFDVLIACAFNFDAMSTEFNKLGRIPVLKARMNADLHMAGDLKNTGKGNLFVIFGEPDIDLINDDDGRIRVKINGVDVFHPNTGEVRSDRADGIACWFIDTDYNEESFFVRHAYFLGQNDPYTALKTTLKAEIDADAWSTLNSDTSRPFRKPKTGRIAVKVINHLGDEVMKVFKV